MNARFSHSLRELRTFLVITALFCLSSIQSLGQQGVSAEEGLVLELPLAIQAQGYQSSIASPPGSSTCGILFGQTPFTVTAFVDSDYNGNDISCNGASDAIVCATVTGGVGPFDYQWFGTPGNNTDPCLSGLGAGTYTILIEDLGQGILCATTVEVSEPAALALFDLIIQEPTCLGECNGSVTAIPLGGTGAYSFDWNGNPASTFIPDVCEGENTLIVTDINGCVLDTTFTIELNNVEPNLTTTDIDCFGESTGSASAFPEGGTGGPYTLTWSNGQSGLNMTDEPAGNYILTINDNGCISEHPFTLDEADEIEIFVLATVDPTCPNFEDGQIQVFVEGGNPPYNYDWSGPDGFTSDTEDLDDLASGDYVLTITDDLDCVVVSETITLDEAPQVIFDPDIQPQTCDGLENGSIDPGVSGGFAPYTFTWTGPNSFSSGDEVIADLAAGTYNLTVVDDHGCITESSFEVPDGSIVVSDVVVNPACQDDATGSIDLDISGGTPTYSVLWAGPILLPSNPFIENLPEGTYTATITDSAGCQEQYTYELQAPNPIVVDADQTPAACNSDFISIDITASGGTGTLSFLWTGPNAFSSDQEDIVDGEPGIYDLTVTDEQGCQYQETFDLSVPNALVISALVTDPDCSGINNGSIELAITGGLPPYELVWTGPGVSGETSEDLFDLDEGDYTVEVTDDQGCVEQQTFTLTRPEAIDATFEVTDVLCFGQNNGAITSNVIGSTGSPSFSWIGPDGFTSNSPNISNLIAGTYTVTIEDGGCSFETTIEVGQPDEITVDNVVIPESCDGMADGNIELTLNGGINPFVIVWEGPGTFTSNDEDIDNLVPGDYTATISDDNGCTVSFDTSVDPGTLIEVSFDITDTQCEQALGSITASPTGGTEPYTYSWVDELGNDLGGNPSINDLAAGVYFVTITEAGGCVTSASASVSDTESATITGTVVEPSCAGEATGSISLEITGNFPPFTVAWGAPISSDELTVENLEAGTYNVVVTDDVGCESSAQFTLTDPPVLDVDATVIDEQCGGAPGAINAVTTGGQEPYNFDWSGPEGYSNDTESILGISAGDYTLIVTDDAGCTFQVDATVEENSLIDITLVSADELCPGSDETGSIDVTVEGGTSPYTFSWTSGTTEVGNGEDLADMPIGSYTLTVTDDEGCEESQSFEISERAPIVIDIIADQPDCAIPNGTLTANPSGGSEPYSYVWMVIENGMGTFIGDTPTLENLPTGSYEIWVEDAHGCEAVANYDLSNAPGDISFEITEPLCFGDSNGTIDITVTGVTAPLTYSWSDENGEFAITEDVTDLSAGQYNVVVTDVNDCTVPATIELTEPDELMMTLVVFPAGCDGTPIGEIQPAVGGGTEPYSYAWTGPGSFTSDQEVITDLSVGNYTLTLTDANFCTLEGSAEVELAETLEVQALIEDVLCAGDATGSISLMTFNGQPEINFDWSGPEGFTADTPEIENLIAGQYDVIIADQSACFVDTFFVVASNDPFDTLLSVSQPECNSDNLGSIDLQAFSSTGALTVDWTGPDNFESEEFELIDISEGEYIYVLTDPLGCQQSDTVNIEVPEVIELSLEVEYGNCDDDRFSVTTTISGGVEPYVFTWTSTDGFSGDTQDLQSVDPGDYTLVVTDDNGCTATAQITVDNIEALILTIDDMGFTPCENASEGFIDITVTGGVGAYTFDWTASNGFTSAGEDISNLLSGFYHITVTDEIGCIALEEDIEIMVETELFVETMPDTEMCLDTAGILITGETVGHEIGYWTDENNELISEELSFMWYETGDYTFILNAESGVCKSSDTLHVSLYAYPMADAGGDLFLFPEDVATIGGSPITDGNHEIEWTPNELITDHLDGTFSVTMADESVMYALEVTSDDGCISRDTVEVNLIPELVVPSGFSPNGDQINDLWQLLGWELYPSLKVGVYNRWGEQLFYSDNGYSQPWDGTVDGRVLPVGTYYYIVEIDEPKLQTTLTGPVTLLE